MRQSIRIEKDISPAKKAIAACLDPSISLTKLEEFSPRYQERILIHLFRMVRHRKCMGVTCNKLVNNEDEAITTTRMSAILVNKLTLVLSF